ncbi:hypothetical protein [Streptantibioticus ferralitis]|uniref:hypothetical protein n=1 Tax=Streptantibioticus ferralitis TaxID=236510 RepID=UPI0023DA2D2E|nr:hypothetical protein [Streptantibioticus ferralitis]
MFYVNVPIRVVTLLLAARLLPSTARAPRRTPLDVPGLALLSPGLAALMYGCAQQSWGVPFAFLGHGPADRLLTAALLVRGAGLGLAMVPGMSAAYASVSRDEAPRAAGTVNVLNRLGGTRYGGTHRRPATPTHRRGQPGCRRRPCLRLGARAVRPGVRSGAVLPRP